MTTARDAAAPASRRALRAQSRRRLSVVSCVVAAMLLLGIGTVTYPTAANWFSDRAHATEVSGYVDSVREASASDLETILAAAREYNEALQSGPLRDPFTLSEDGSAKDIEDGWDAYVAHLDFGKNRPMARVRVPEIGVDLPVYHGTTDDVLTKGVGHLFGTSLPVGGGDTHAVLSGHSGIPGRDLFSRVNEMTLGDVIYVDVAGETLVYRVDQILTVQPDDAENLRRVIGQDHLTLLTCTPIGVNSHRLLVRGERVDEDAASDSATSIAPNATDPGFPWWALWSGAALVGCLWIAWPRPPHRSVTGLHP